MNTVHEECTFEDRLKDIVHVEKKAAGGNNSYSYMHRLYMIHGYRESY